MSKPQPGQLRRFKKHWTAGMLNNQPFVLVKRYPEYTTNAWRWEFMWPSGETQTISEDVLNMQTESVEER